MLNILIHYIRVEDTKNLVPADTTRALADDAILG